MAKLIAGLFLLVLIAGGSYLYATRAVTMVIRPTSGRVDLSGVLPGDWDRVCIIAPYSTNSRAREVLGIPVNIELRSSIAWLDSTALLVTLNGADAAGLYEVPRSGVDFSHLGGECYTRGDAGFTVPEEGYPRATHT